MGAQLADKFVFYPVRRGINGLVCSARGRCDCNTCFCSVPDIRGQTVFGAACECDNFRCPRTGTEEVCSGIGNEHY